MSLPRPLAGAGELRSPGKLICAPICLQWFTRANWRRFGGTFHLCPHLFATVYEGELAAVWGHIFVQSGRAGDPAEACPTNEAQPPGNGQTPDARLRAHLSQPLSGCQAGGSICAYSTTRSSPSRRVILSRSSNSSSGMAYLREMPVHSLNWGTRKRSPLWLLSNWCSRAIAVW
jgi:hypothetical protein